MKLLLAVNHYFLTDEVPPTLKRWMRRNYPEATITTLDLVALAVRANRLGLHEYGSTCTTAEKSLADQVLAKMIQEDTASLWADTQSLRARPTIAKAA